MWAEVDHEGFLIHLLQADDVGVEAQQLREDERPPVAGVQKPARRVVMTVCLCLVINAAATHLKGWRSKDL